MSFVVSMLIDDSAISLNKNLYTSTEAAYFPT